MKSVSRTTALLLSATVILGACVSQAPPPQPVEQVQQNYPVRHQAHRGSYGVIDSIEVIRQERSNTGAGLVVGGLVGGVVGNQIGGGSGNTAATVIGVVGGAVVGNNIERNRNNAQTTERYQIHIQLNNGDRISVMEDSISDLRVGDRVRLVDGHVYRN